jgi:hypothetical protein
MLSLRALTTPKEEQGNYWGLWVHNELGGGSTVMKTLQRRLWFWNLMRHWTVLVTLLVLR